MTTIVDYIKNHKALPHGIADIVGLQDSLGTIPTSHTSLDDIGSNAHSVIDTHLGKTNLNAHGATASADINFANYKAISMVCDNGATIPTSGIAKGQSFLHTPTGRNIKIFNE